MATRMLVADTEFRFVPVDRGAIWARLCLTINQVSELTGLSRRQLSHWVSRGYLIPASSSPVLFDGNTVEQAIYIKQGLDGGLSVRKAVAQANRFIAEQLRNEPAMQVVRTPAVVDLEAKVRSAHSALGIVLEVLSPLAQEHVEAMGIDGDPNCASGEGSQ